jgi:hypothetical protein
MVHNTSPTIRIFRGVPLGPYKSGNGNWEAVCCFVPAEYNHPILVRNTSPTIRIFGMVPLGRVKVVMTKF